MKELTIKKDDSGQRIDRFLRKILPNVPLSHIYKCIRKKRIKVNGKRIWSDYIINENDNIKLYIPREEIVTTPEISVSHIKHTIFYKKNFNNIYEDDDILALNKPPFIVVHPGTKYATGQTLIDLARSYLGTSGAATFEPSLIHRLDKDTSGIILIAKNSATLRNLTKQLKNKQIKKTYTALVAGKIVPKKGTFNQKLLRTKDAQVGGKVKTAQTNNSQAKEAITHYTVIKEFKKYTLLSIILETGRTHQIRVHLASNNHPIIGDSVYGNFEINKKIEALSGLKRQFLHATSLTFFHPTFKRNVTIHSNLPKDLEDCLKIL